MSGYFWEGFEKRAVDWKGLVGKGKAYASKAMGSIPDDISKQVKHQAKEFGRTAKEGLHEGVRESAKNLSKRVGAFAGQRAEDIAKNVGSSGMWDHIRGLMGGAGLAKAPKKGLLERAGEAVKKHPYISAAGGAAGLGGAAYAVGRSGKPKDEGYQYYNPYA